MTGLSALGRLLVFYVFQTENSDLVNILIEKGRCWKEKQLDNLLQNILTALWLVRSLLLLIISHYNTLVGLKVWLKFVRIWGEICSVEIWAKEIQQKISKLFEANIFTELLKSLFLSHTKWKALEVYRPSHVQRPWICVGIAELKALGVLEHFKIYC